VSEQDQCPKCSEAVAVRTEDYITYGCASIGHVDGSFAQSNYCKARAELQASQQREADKEERIAELEGEVERLKNGLVAIKEKLLRKVIGPGCCSICKANYGRHFSDCPMELIKELLTPPTTEAIDE
jgi:hypothetical protein